MSEKHFVDMEKAFNSRDIAEFMDIVFPPSWGSIKSRIIESGVKFEETDIGKFALGWSFIPLTMRYSKRGKEEETWFKSVIFRVHDVLHQLFPIFVPQKWDDEELSYLKRTWMCSEMAVLTLTEFVYCKWLYDTQDHLREFLEFRNTLLFLREPNMRIKKPADIASFLDQLLHLQVLPKWILKSEYGTTFLQDFLPMLEEDRININHNIRILREQENKDYLQLMPTPRYSRYLDGRELTVAMIKDFKNLLKYGGDTPDRPLAIFNQERRSKVNLPDTWNLPPKEQIEQMWLELGKKGFYKK